MTICQRVVCWRVRNTVQTHVSHILAKLGARSRAEILSEAARHPQADPASD
jgi:DNA-binding NarL/FixJ family response regulator